jgi:type VI secretion system protein ImpF
MSGRGPRGAERTEGVRAQLPLLDRLIDDAPDTPRDPPVSPAEAMAALRRSVRRDLEALLNGRRRWRSWPAGYAELRVSPLGYGIPDFTSGALNDPRRRESLRAEIEDTIRRFEPRFASVRVTLLENKERLEATLRLRIDALLHAEPAPEPVAFDTLVDATTADVVVRPRDDV